MNEDIGHNVFANKRNITVGTGRVLWANGCADTSGRVFPAGWVLPGGQRTQDEAQARAAAEILDGMSR